MVSENVNVRITGELRQHLERQIGKQGLYENASEYIRDLIRRDVKSRQEAWDWLRTQLEPGMKADRREFITVSAEDVIARNRNPGA